MRTVSDKRKETGHYDTPNLCGEQRIRERNKGRIEMFWKGGEERGKQAVKTSGKKKKKKKKTTWMWKRQMSLMLSLEVFSPWNVLDSFSGEEGRDRKKGEKDR